MANIDAYNLIISIVVAISTVLTVIVSFWTVKKASKNNEIAIKQYQDNIKINEESNRPILDLAIKEYEVDLTESYFSEWDKETSNYVPSEFSSSFLELTNIGNKTARDVSIAFYYSGLEEMQKILPYRLKRKQQTREFSIDLLPSKERNNTYLFYGKTIKNEEKFVLDDGVYDERYGSIHPYIDGQDNFTKIYLPKLFVYLTNSIGNKIDGMGNEIGLIVKINYTDPYKQKYFQSFRMGNQFRKRESFDGNKLVVNARLFPEEVENTKVKQSK